MHRLDVCSADFPTTPDALQLTKSPGRDAFVTVLNSAGSALVYSTFLCGNDGAEGQGIALDNAGSAYVTGFTESTNFPTTQP
jgi:Beta-propeller repeat